MLLQTFEIFLIFSTFADAFVEFEKSRLYDEQDFNRQGTVNLPNYCSPGCNIYVSVPEHSKDIARNIKIEAYQDGQISLTDADVTAADGLKTPYNVRQGNAQVDFINSNPGQTTAPVLVWVVRGDAPNQDAEVYDAKGTSRLASPAGIITVLNTEPFTLNVISTGPPFAFEAITAGFDALNDEDQCTRVIQEDSASYQDLVADVRSPLITLVLNSGATQIALTTFASSFEDHDLGLAQFVTSPGYIGCAVKTDQLGTQGVKTFRSSLYATVTDYKLASDEVVTVELSSDLNVDDAHAVSIVADGQEPISWSDANTAPVVLSAKELTVSWTRNDADLNKYFMVRVQPSLDAKKTTTAEPEHTTTLEPEPADRTTTGEPEPEDQSTTEPEPAVRTTTMEPEPDQTTTVEDEPVQTTTEAEQTTTMEQEDTTTKEPEKTTTEPIMTSTREPTTTDVPESIVTTTEEPEKTAPIKTTTPYKRHSTPPPVRTTSTTSFHPKSTPAATIPTSTVTTTVPNEPTTSSTNTGSYTLLIAVAAVIIFSVFTMIHFLLLLCVFPVVNSYEGLAGTVDTDDYKGYTQHASIQGGISCEKKRRTFPLAGIHLYLYENDKFLPDDFLSQYISNDDGSFLLKGSVSEKMSPPKMFIHAAISCDFIRSDPQFAGCEVSKTNDDKWPRRMVNLTDQCPSGEAVVFRRELKEKERPKLGDYDVECKVNLSLGGEIYDTVRSYENAQTERACSTETTFEKKHLATCYTWGHAYRGETVYANGHVL